MEKEVKKNNDNNTKNFVITNEIKTLVECRVLFITLLDKIFILILILTLIITTINNFYGDFSSIGYGFWERVLRELFFIGIMYIVYLFLNWIYKCLLKTMLCVTNEEIYKEIYLPFYKSEKSIPLNKVTSISTHNYFFIFRCVAIHQYNKFPMIFFTWDNKIFKNKVNELLTSRKKDIENIYEDRNIITKDKYKYTFYFSIIIIAIIIIFGIIRLICYIAGEERKIIGSYINEKNKIVLKKDGKCNIDDIIKKVTDCDWTYNKNDKEIIINYEYKSTYFYGKYNDSMKLKYNSNKKTIQYEEVKYKLK